MKKKYLTVIIFQTFLIITFGLYFSIKTDEQEKIAHIQYEEIMELRDQLNMKTEELEQCQNSEK